MHNLDEARSILAYRHALDPIDWLAKAGIAWRYSRTEMIVLVVVYQNREVGEASTQFFAVPKKVWPEWLGQALYDWGEIEVVDNDLSRSLVESEELAAGAWLLSLCQPAECFLRSEPTIRQAHDGGLDIDLRALRAHAGQWYRRYRLDGAGVGTIRDTFGANIIHVPDTPADDDFSDETDLDAALPNFDVSDEAL